ncbi:MAG: hypothetical protein ACP5HG_12165, partial [Anaerolineae bacterium]
MHILTRTDDQAGNLTGPQSESEALSEAVQDGVTEALSDLPTTVVWVEAREEVPMTEPPERMEGNGAIITLGNIQPQDEDAVHVGVSIWVAMLAAGG